ncbi:NADPH:quinone reductase [Pusillimonas sp. SM2304]|uniref:NADPH:quinone reductase n=1 Tax=Pusillimonas sp. SM2304 TaxID=3073241 RepID=UPI002874CA00|nr:NADPH:quinone reductase [Pusillimonas sp. SM2304]MDS1138822.1 NADPH:quinone reductase [Pusillimonas sp. SM2304]
MKAAWYSKNGDAASVLQVGEIPTPQAGPGEVRVKLLVSGVNPSDVKSRAGSRPVVSGFVIPHSDGAGIIDQVGSGVDPKRIGERVWLWNGQWQRTMGTAAQYIALPSQQAVHMPTNTTFEAGACLGIPALTAARAVELAGDLKGKTVLVTAAASAVGFYAAQMARLRGARVIGTIGSDEKAAFLKAAGFQEIIFYKKEPVAERISALTQGAGVDVIIDMDFSSSAALVPQGAVAHHGAIVCYGSNFRGDVPIAFGAWLPRSLSLHFFLVYDLLEPDRRQALDSVQSLLELGVLQHQIGQTFQLDDIAAAHQAVEAGKVLGNVVVSL